MSKTISIHLETEKLAKETYQIVVYWIAQYDGTGNNQLFLATPLFNFTRSLSAWEVSG